MNNKTSVVIVGGGVSGSTCALFLARAGINSVILDLGKPIINLAMLNNYPGLIPTRGSEWMTSVHEGLKSNAAVQIHGGKVTELRKTEQGFDAVLEDGQLYSSDYLVLASGGIGIDYAASLGLVPIKAVQPYVKFNVTINSWGETTVPRVYACGVVSGCPSQAVICAGSGATVAVGIASQIKGEYWVDHDTPPKKV
jgi:thioredoxin reductase (NADPH)